MKRIVAIWIGLVLLQLNLKAVDSAMVNVAKKDSIAVIDSIQKPQKLVPKNLLDSLALPYTLRHYFFQHENIRGITWVSPSHQESRDLPRLKSIKLRKTTQSHWKFWILFTTILFVALIRLMNVKRFDEIIFSAFDLHADFKSYSDKTGNYFASNVGLFVNFILSLSLFFTTILETNHQVETDNYYLLFWKLVVVFILLYAGKIILGLLIGTVFRMRGISTITLFNTIMVNNILGVALVFLNLFFVFVADPTKERIISATILVTILVAVIYRQIKNLIMTFQSGRFQFIYIFIYLCALEILPWMVVFKMFLNAW
jgi:hypothetical protein